MADKKIAVVSGGTKGIGKQIVSDLLVRGYRVFTNYGADSVAANAASAEFARIGECIVADSKWGGGIMKLLENEAHVDVIVGNAGTTLRKPFPQITDAEWQHVLDVNLTENFSLVRDLYPKISHGGRIVFIGSLMGVFPHGTSLPYGVSKAALHALAQNLVKEFEGTGTTVNAIAPGFVETEWQRNKPEEIRQNIYRKTAVKRFADVREISSAVMFCIDNAFVNGALLEISGGYSFK